MEIVQDSVGIKRKLQKTKHFKRSYYIHETLEAMRKGHLTDKLETEILLKELKDKLEKALPYIIGCSFLTEDYAVALQGAVVSIKM